MGAWMQYIYMAMWVPMNLVVASRSAGGRTHAFAASTRMERPEQDWLVYVINAHVDRAQERRRVIAEEFE